MTKQEETINELRSEMSMDIFRLSQVKSKLLSCKSVEPTDVEDAINRLVYRTYKHYLNKAYEAGAEGEEK